MNKKFLSLVLALVMVLGTFGNVFAAAATDKKEVPKLTSTDAKVQWLIDNSIVVGNADENGKVNGNMDLTSPIRRDAAAKMLVYAVGAQDLAAKLQGQYRPFPDVEVTNIMNGLIAAAASSSNANGVAIITGYEDGLFRPTKNVTYAELAKMLVVAIDKDLTPEKAKTYSWPQGWLARAAQLGIFDGLSIDKANDPAVRREAFAMIYNAFYQLKEIKAVPANETRGIISEHQKGKTLVLNQGEFKKEFKVNENTIFVNLEGKNEKWIGGRSFDDKNYYVGSLVRVLADKDGVVTHIIEMGNPYEGINEKNSTIAWVDLGKVELQKDSSFERDGKKEARKKVKPVEVGKDYVKLADAKYDVTSKTEVYVADYAAGALTQVKDFAAAKDLLADKVEGVYVGYEALPKNAGNEARIIVFNEVSKKTTQRFVRVAKTVSTSDYLLSVNAPGEKQTALEQFDLRDNSKVWPYNYGFVRNDVISIDNNKFANDEVVISFEKDPIVKINKFLLIKGDDEKEVTRAEANAVELIDKDDYTAVFALPTDYKAFFGNSLTKGAHVQYALDGNKITVLSEVGTAALKGDVVGGKPSYLKTATVVDVKAADGALSRVLVKYKDEKKEVALVAPKALADALEKGKEYDLLLGKVDKDYAEYEILKADLSAAQVAADKAEADKKAADAFADAVKAAKDEKDYTVDAAAAIKTELEGLVKKYEALTAEQKDLAKDALAALNKKIVAYNALDPDTAEDLTEVK